MDPAAYLAAVLFALGLLILIVPVASRASYDGKFTPVGSDGSEVCGLAIVQAFVTPSGENDTRSEQKVDCAAKARARIGYGLLLLLLSIPPAFITLRRAKQPEETGRTVVSGDVTS